MQKRPPAWLIPVLALLLAALFAPQADPGAEAASAGRSAGGADGSAWRRCVTIPQPVLSTLLCWLAQTPQPGGRRSPER